MSTLQSAQVPVWFVLLLFFFFFSFKCLASFQLQKSISVDQVCKFVSVFEFLQNGVLQKIHESVLSHTVFTLVQQK